MTSFKDHRSKLEDNSLPWRTLINKIKIKFTPQRLIKVKTISCSDAAKLYFLSLNITKIKSFPRYADLFLHFFANLAAPTAKYRKTFSLKCSSEHLACSFAKPTEKLPLSSKNFFPKTSPKMFLDTQNAVSQNHLENLSLESRNFPLKA